MLLLEINMNYDNSYEVGYSSVIVVRHSVRPSIRIFVTAIEQNVFEPQPCSFTHRCTPKGRQTD